MILYSLAGGFFYQGGSEFPSFFSKVIFLGNLILFTFQPLKDKFSFDYKTLFYNFQLCETYASAWKSVDIFFAPFLCQCPTCGFLIFLSTVFLFGMKCNFLHNLLKGLSQGFLQDVILYQQNCLNTVISCSEKTIFHKCTCTEKIIDFRQSKLSKSVVSGKIGFSIPETVF